MENLIKSKTREDRCSCLELSIRKISDNKRHFSSAFALLRRSLGDGGAGGHVHEHHDQEHDHSQRGQHHRGDLLPGLLHGLLPLLLVLRRLLLGLPFELPHLSWGRLGGRVQRGFSGKGHTPLVKVQNLL